MSGARTASSVNVSMFTNPRSKAVESVYCTLNYPFRIVDAPVQIQSGGDHELGGKLAGKQLDHVARIDHAERRAEVQQVARLEFRRAERVHIALVRLERLRIGGETARREHRRFHPQHDALAAMRRLGHRAGIGGQAAAAGRRDAQRMRLLPGIQAKHMPRRDRRTHRSDHRRRMETNGAVMAGGTDPARHFNPLDQRGHDVSACQLAGFRKRQDRRQRGGQRVIGRVPHRLEIQHVH
ncbi:MAG: hypothetical protein ABSC95_22885 [Acetobacteraceae bacterium]